MAEANYYQDGERVDYTPTAALVAGQVVQLADGRAAVATSAIAAGVKGSVQVCGVVQLAKTSGVVVLNGDPIYWDISAGTATPLKAVAGADHFIGVAQADATSTGSTVYVALNVKPQYTIDLQRDSFESVIVKTVVGSTTVTIPDVVTRGCQTQLTMGLTAEAQKVDLMSTNSIPKTVPFIVEGRVAVYDIGDDAALDINIGIANGTHATSFDSITEYLSFHLDGNVLTILVQSTDGTTTNAAATTTISAVDDTYFDFRLDCRDLTACKAYINGVRVMDGTTGASKTLGLSAATGPFKLIAHMEKTSNDTPGEIRVAHFAARTMEQAA